MECQAGKGGKVWQGWGKKGKRGSNEGVVKRMGGNRVGGMGRKGNGGIRNPSP